MVVDMFLDLAHAISAQEELQLVIMNLMIQLLMHGW